MVNEEEHCVIEGEEVSFCTRLDVILSSMVRRGNTSEIPQLLVDFYHYYAFEFKYIDCVVSIRSSEEMLKKTRWREKSKSWRFSIEDPFEKDRDLGCVLTHAGQIRILDEFKRAFQILTSGGDMAALCEVCDPKDSFTKRREREKKITAANDQNQKPKPSGRNRKKGDTRRKK